LNGPGLAAKIATVIRGRIAACGTTELVFSGNSMGATMARLMPVDRVIALAPQDSVCRSVVPEEKRWAFFRNKIEDFPFLAVDEWPAEAMTFVIHGTAPDELAHARRFPVAGPNVEHVVVRGFKHNFPARLRKSGHSARLMPLMIEGRRWRARRLLTRLGGTPRAKYLEEEGATWTVGAIAARSAR
jgi:hypothetical protein